MFDRITGFLETQNGSTTRYSPTESSLVIPSHAESLAGRGGLSLATLGPPNSLMNVSIALQRHGNHEPDFVETLAKYVHLNSCSKKKIRLKNVSATMRDVVPALPCRFLRLHRIAALSKAWFDHTRSARKAEALEAVVEHGRKTSDWVIGLVFSAREDSRNVGPKSWHCSALKAKNYPQCTCMRNRACLAARRP